MVMSRINWHMNRLSFGHVCSGAQLSNRITGARKSRPAGLSKRSTKIAPFDYQPRRYNSQLRNLPDMGIRQPQLPPGSWCSHMHVATSNYPLSSSAAYKLQHDHTLEDALSYYSQWAVKNLVFVQPSIFGKDNSCLLDGLRETTPEHGRGVVEIDPNNISKEQLQEWHDLGVRGVRVNFVSSGREPTSEEVAAELEAHAKAIRPFKTWALDIYMPMSMSDVLVDIVPKLGVKFAIAHCGNPKLPDPFAGSVDPYAMPGFQSLLTLLKQGQTWVKISAPYRLSHDLDMRDLEPVIKEMLFQAPDRVCWAGDWPHTRYEGKVTLNPFIEKCFEWTAGEDENERRTKLFKTNTEELFDVR